VINRTKLFDRESSIFIPQGLYVLRYDSTVGEHDHPMATVHPIPGCETSIQVISGPGAEPGRLDGPGAALCIRASAHGHLHVGIKRARADGSLSAALTLETLGRNGSVPPATESATAAPTTPFVGVEQADRSAHGALFVAHIARRGDIAIASNTWAAGPRSPAPIEGIEMLPLPTERVQAEIQVLNSAANEKWSEWSGPGAFSGTRGMSLPLIALRLRLTGPDAHLHYLNADALFLGAPIVNRRGREIEFRSEAGSDPLVGLRFELCPERRATPRSTRTASPQNADPRVRVFRAASA
jgi:hypothetical protein